MASILVLCLAACSGSPSATATVAAADVTCPMVHGLPATAVGDRCFVILFHGTTEAIDAWKTAKPSASEKDPFDHAEGTSFSAFKTLAIFAGAVRAVERGVTTFRLYRLLVPSEDMKALNVVMWEEGKNYGNLDPDAWIQESEDAADAAAHFEVRFTPRAIARVNGWKTELAETWSATSNGSWAKNEPWVKAANGCEDPFGLPLVRDGDDCFIQLWFGGARPLEWKREVRLFADARTAASLGHQPISEQVLYSVRLPVALFRTTRVWYGDASLPRHEEAFPFSINPQITVIRAFGHAEMKVYDTSLLSQATIVDASAGAADSSECE